ncbi:DUF6507 family protein [Arachnia propionica]|uniref:DUF6507 family protein n=1 Tax=Arachnia propionica TaxID=1750 RepID=UPI0030CAEED3
MKYSVDPGSCEAIFNQVEGYVSDASSAHTSVSGDIDSLGSACSTGLAAPIASALNQAYNFSLTTPMTTAEQQTTNAVAGGRGAVSAIQRGDEEMTNNSETAANEVDEVTIQDGKQA